MQDTILGHEFAKICAREWCTIVRHNFVWQTMCGKGLSEFLYGRVCCGIVQWEDFHPLRM